MIERITEILQEAGEIARGYFGKIGHENVEFKGVADLVTHADREIEEFLRHRLAEASPDVSFFGEEGEYESLDALNEVFIVDPLDGTTNFVHRHPFYSISLAYRENGQTKLGAVYLPEFGDLYHASLGEGAFLNEKAIKVSEARELVNALGATGFADVRQRVKPDNLPLFNEIIYALRGIRRCGSAAIDLCYVAEGRYDLFWEYNLSPWDIAAGALIVAEAGGIVSDLGGGGEYETKRQIVATDPEIHPNFVQIAAKYQS